MSGDQFPVPVRQLGTAAEKLADTVRHVVDLVAGADRIVAKAKAQAEAEIIAAEGRGHVQEIEARAVGRLRKRETRRQKNIEEIVDRATTELPPPEQVSKAPVSEDWTTRFFEECQDIGDEQMQQIWGRILAGEIAVPGSFAPRTLSMVKNLTKNDAELFSTLCGAVWYLPGIGFMPIVHDYKAAPFAAAGLTFMALIHLTSIGLIEYSNIAGYGVDDQRVAYPQYCGKIHALNCETVSGLPLGSVVFTSAGAELMKVVRAAGNEEFRSAALSGWAASGWKESVQQGPTGESSNTEAA